MLAVMCSFNWITAAIIGIIMMIVTIIVGIIFLPKDASVGRIFAIVIIGLLLGVLFGALAGYTDPLPKDNIQAVICRALISMMQ